MSKKYELELKSSYEECERALDLIEEIDREFSFDEDLKSKLQLVLSEAVTNGIVHGNKLDTDKTVKVEADADASDNRIVFTVTDQGEGFEYNKKSDPLSEENLLKTGGRGLFIIEEIADNVRYEDDGRKVIITFKI